MTVLTFTQVILRYGFNSGFLRALETDFYLLAWLFLPNLAFGPPT